MKIAWALLFAAACSGQNSAGSSNPSGNSGTAADAGTGGVSFGGAQDFGQFRGILDSGGIPGPDTLDANGFFNEHYAPPPNTGCTDTLCMTPGLSVGKDWITGSHQAALQIAVDTNVDPSTVVKQPLNLVVVVDHSGSMAQDGRLDKVKAGLDVLIDQLDDTDRLAIVQFDDGVQTLAPFGETLDRTALHNVVHTLQPAGATDIFDGLKDGFDLSVGALASNRQNRVIFLSDGNATAGNTDQGAILAMADGYVERGIGLTTVGVGSDFDVNLMKGLAEHGAGNFYFLEDPSAATEVFQQELAYFVSPIALDISLSAVAGGGYNFGEVVGTTLWNGTTRGGSLHIPAAFVASRTGPAPDPGTGGRRGGGSMLFIHIDPTGMNTDGKVADFVLTYHVPGSTEIKSQNVTLQYTNDPNETPDDPYLSAPEMAARYAMYNMYLGFRQANQQAASYSYNCAMVTLRAVQAAATAWNATHENQDIASDLTLVGEYMQNLVNHGASSDETLTADSCYYGGYGSGGYGGDAGDWGEGNYGNDQEYGGCYSASRGGTKATFALIGIAALWNIRRRRSVPRA
ncbi:MAG: VWA domain-containing protein [Kofleriaceae bacterium]